MRRRWHRWWLALLVLLALAAGAMVGVRAVIDRVLRPGWGVWTMTLAPDARVAVCAPARQGEGTAQLWDVATARR